MTDPMRPGAAAIAHDWWQRLTTTDGAQVGRRRAALARMRRAATAIEVMQEPEALRLVARLLPRSPERVAMLAGILAFVRESDERTVARAVGRASLDDDQSAQLSEGRFRRLLQARPDELMETMRRLLRLTKGRANVRDLSSAILYWGDNVKKRWIFDYYAVAGSTPSEESASTSSASTRLER